MTAATELRDELRRQGLYGPDAGEPLPDASLYAQVLDWLRVRADPEGRLPPGIFAFAARRSGIPVWQLSRAARLAGLWVQWPRRW